MSQPEYILADSERIHHTENRRAYFDQIFMDQEVERLRLAFTLALRLLNSYPKDLGFEELLQVLRSEHLQDTEV